MNKLTLQHDKNGTEFSAVLADMQEQFPLNELKHRETFERLLKGGDYQLLIARDGEKKIGYLFVYRDRPSNTLWLDYFAVFARYHSKGYGSKLLPLLKTHYPRALGCFLEVEKPQPQLLNTVRRVDFYRRLGAKRLDLDYYFPHAAGALAMHLYFLPFSKEGVPPFSARKILRVIKRVFGTLHADIPHASQVLERIGSRPCEPS